MRTVQKIAFYFGMLNLVIGLAGFIGPLITKNDQKIINTKPGLLFGIFAINWVHALVHLLAGIGGILARAEHNASRTYLWFSSILFGALTSMGVAVFGFRRGIHLVMGMALNRQDNILHGVFTLVAAVGAMWKPGFHLEALLEEFKEKIEDKAPVHSLQHETEQITP